MLRRSAAGNIRYALAAAGVPRASAHRARRRIARRWSGSTVSSAARRGGCRAASSSGWRWRARWRAIRRCCFSTSRPPASIPPPPRRSRTSCAPSAARGVKVVMATHDLGQARRLAGDIVLLHRGRLIESGPAAEFLRPIRARRKRGHSSPANCWSRRNDTRRRIHHVHIASAYRSPSRSAPSSLAAPRRSRRTNRSWWPRPPRRRIPACSNICCRSSRPRPASR